eukprot:357723-Chlamydomonas_euryale.AAC.17
MLYNDDALLKPALFHALLPGLKVLHRISLAMLLLHEAQLLACDNAADPGVLSHQLGCLVHPLACPAKDRRRSASPQARSRCCDRHAGAHALCLQRRGWATQGTHPPTEGRPPGKHAGGVFCLGPTSLKSSLADLHLIMLRPGACTIVACTATWGCRWCCAMGTAQNRRGGVPAFAAVNPG